ncbi:MAG: glycosyltransferase [Desulforhopalus sp.]
MAKYTPVDIPRKSGGYITLLLPELRIGGAQRVFLTLAKDFIARGFNVDLVVLANEGELLVEVPQGVRLVPLVNRPFSKRVMLLPILVFKLIRYLKKNQPDALLSTLTGTNLLAVIAHNLSNVNTRLVLREASPLANLRHSYFLFLMRFLYKKADSVIVLTDFMKKEVEKELKLPSQIVNQIPNPIDLERIERAAKEPLPKDFDCSQPYAIAVGRLVPPKDYLTLVNAFAEVPNTISLKLVILGEGPDRSILEKRIRELCLNDRIVLRGFDSNPYRWIARASLFLMSSRWEGFPNVLLEALALRKPVVSTIYDSSVLTLLSNQTGIAVQVGDTSAFAEAITNTIRGAHFSENRLLPIGVLSASSDYLNVLGFESKMNKT